MKIISVGAAALSLTLVAGIFVLAGGLSRGLEAQETGVLTGRVTYWPKSPVEGPGISREAKPVVGVKIIISKPGGEEVATVESDHLGKYRVQLPPGTYHLQLAPGRGRFTKDLSAAITIAPGQETRRDIRVDTGIR